MKQSDYKLLEPYFAFFKEDVDLSFTHIGQVLAKQGELSIVFSIPAAGYNNSPETLPAGATTSPPMLGILSLDEHPKGTFDFEIRYEDGEKAEWNWEDSTKCPFCKAIERNFPNLSLKSVFYTEVYQKIGEFGTKKIATIADSFTERSMSKIKETKQPFKTTITFL